MEAEDAMDAEEAMDEADKIWIGTFSFDITSEFDSVRVVLVVVVVNVVGTVDEFNEWMCPVAIDFDSGGDERVPRSFHGGDFNLSEVDKIMESFFS